MVDIDEQRLIMIQMDRMKEEEDEYKEAIRQLYFWQFSNEDPSRATNFTGLVFILISKAQCTPSSMLKLETGFPHEVRAWREWCISGNDGNDLFAKYGFYPAHREKEFKESIAKSHKKAKGKEERDNFNSWMDQQRKKNECSTNGINNAL